MNPNLRPADRCLLSQDDFSRDSQLPFGYWDSPRRRTGEWLVVGIAVATVIALVLWFGGWWG